MSAETLPCAGCHGRDGKGRPEGGVTPSDLTWGVLSRPYGVTHPSGRSHPPYDAHTLKRAVTLGLDPAGNPLQAAMPRYRMSQDQAAALVAYLQILGSEQDPGVAADHVRLGVLLPEAPEDAAARRTLDTLAAKISASGGIYGRRLEMRYLEAPAGGVGGAGGVVGTGGAVGAGGDGTGRDAAAWREAVARFAAREEPFALVASAAAGAEAPLADLSAELELPVVGALTPAPRPGAAAEALAPGDRYVFYLQPGLAEQARALVEGVAEGVGGVARQPGLLVAGARDADLGGAARDELTRAGLHAWTGTYRGDEHDLAAKIVAASRAGVDALVFVGDADDARNLLVGAEELAWHPRVFMLAELAAGAVLDAPPAFAGRLYLAAPSVPSDLTPEGAALLAVAGLTSAGGAAPPVRATVYERQVVAAFELLSEALTRCGRDLTRDRLISVLEGLHGWTSGLGPPLTFGPDRRLGAMGAYIVAYDPGRGGLVPAAGWVTPR